MLPGDVTSACGSPGRAGAYASRLSGAADTCVARTCVARMPLWLTNDVRRRRNARIPVPRRRSFTGR